MARFSDLPNEIIIEVWRQVLDPDAVESFALTSKMIYSLGISFIQEHNELKARFSSIVHCDHNLGSGPAETLKTLLLDPRTALYVRHISIDPWQRWWEDSDDSEIPGHTSYPEETMELFRQAIESSPFIRKYEVLPWINELEKGDEDAIHALIVMRIPNVKAFTLLSVEQDQWRLSVTIKRIAESQDTEALSRLEEVRLGREDVDWVDLFAALPSVKTIRTVEYC